MEVMVGPSSSDSFKTAQNCSSYSTNSLRNNSSSEGIFKSTEHSPNNLTPMFTHRRVISNPFDILYKPNSGHSPHKAPKLESEGGYVSPKSIKSTAYLEIEKSINEGKMESVKDRGNTAHKVQHKRVISEVPPTITIIDESEQAKRSGSVVSRSATLRNRNRIKSRNRMVRKAELEKKEDDASTINENKKWERKLRYKFPVKRITSLKRGTKYKPLNQSRSNFENAEQLQQFLKSCNANMLIREIMPHKMKIFNYNRLVHVNPSLGSITREIQITDNNVFHVAAPIATSDLKISLPIKETLTKPEYKNNGSRQPTRKQFSLIDTAYTKYKNNVFPKKVLLPPKFAEIFPDERDKQLLTNAEIENLNRQLLLEILIRRTVAAKIEYRLKQNGVWDKRIKKDISSTSSSASSSSSNRTANDAISPKSTESDTSSSCDNESINTDDIMQQNVSLFSELLPSPQISYQSNIFGSIYPHDEDYYEELTDPKESKNLSISSKSGKTTCLNEQKEVIKEPNLTPSSVYSSHKSSVSPKFKVDYNSSPESLYINNFNKAYFAQYRNNKDLDEIEQALFSSNVYQLIPMNRSIATLSTSDGSLNITGTIPPSGFEVISHKSSNNISTTFNETTSHSSVQKPKRKSESTANTSIFQDLDDLSSELSSFLNDDFTPKNDKFIEREQCPQATKDFEEDEAKEEYNHLPKQEMPNEELHRPLKQACVQNRESNQSLLDSLNKENSPLELKITPAPQPIQEQNRAIDVKSMKGSISVVETSSNTDWLSTTSSSPTNKLSQNLDTIDEINIGNCSREPKSTDSTHSNHKFVNNLVIGRHDSNSTRSIVSSHRKELSYSSTLLGRKSELSYNPGDSNA